MMKEKNYNLNLITTQAKVNTASKEIGNLMRQGQKEQADALKAEVASLKTSIDPLKDTNGRG